MSKRLKYILFAGVLLLVAFNVVAEYKFPPPEFETGYNVPVQQFPDTRAVWLGYLDVAVLIVFLTLASLLSLKKRSRNGMVALSILSLLYFGLWKRGCVCSIGSIQNVTLALFNGNYALPFTVIAFFALPLITALFFGRAFCSGVCPQGAMQDLLLIKGIKIPRWLDRGLSLFAYFYLGLAVLFAATDTMFIICKFDPFVSFFRVSGQTYLVVIGIVFLILSMFIGRPYCRYFCPYGVILKFLALFSKNKVTVTPAECINCTLCDEACPYDAIVKPADSKEAK